MIAYQDKCGKLKSPKTIKFGYWSANLESASYKDESLPRFEDDGRYIHPITRVKEARDISKKRVSMSSIETSITELIVNRSYLTRSIHTHSSSSLTLSVRSIEFIIL